MKNYKNLGYTIRAKFAKLDGETPTGEKWNENLSSMMLPDNADPATFSDTYKIIIDSFENLLANSSYDPYEQQAILSAVDLTELVQEIDEDPTAGITTGGDTVNFSLKLAMITGTADNISTNIKGYWRGDLDSDTVPILDTFTRRLASVTINTYKGTEITAVLKPLNPNT